MSIINHQTLVLSPDCEPLRDFMLSVPERFAKGEGIVIHKSSRLFILRISLTAGYTAFSVHRKPSVRLCMPRCF